MAITDYTEGKTKAELLQAIGAGVAAPTSPVSEHIRMTVLNMCTEEIVAAVDESTATYKKLEKSNKKLTKVIFALDVIFGIATLLGTGLAVYGLFIR